MKVKSCIFNSKKECSNCDECNVCDINRKKKCDSCGMCLELEGYDTKAIGITEFHKTDIEVRGNDESESGYKDEPSNGLKKSSIETELVEDDREPEFTLDDYDPNESFELDKDTLYLDDVEGLSEIMCDPEMQSKILNESYPGLLKFKSN